MVYCKQREGLEQEIKFHLGLFLCQALVPGVSQLFLTLPSLEPLLPLICLLLFSHSVVSNSLRLHGPQHTRLPYPSPSPGVCSDSCPLSWRCYPTISSSIVPFSSHPQSFPASGYFPMSQLFASGGQNIGVSASASVFPLNIQD